MYFVKTEAEDVSYYSPPVDFREVAIDYKIFKDRESVVSYIAKNKLNNNDYYYEYDIYKVDEGEPIKIICDDNSRCFENRERTSVD